MEIKENDIINIHQFLPHRNPMLMTDYILELTKVGDKIISKASLISQYENICNIFCETFNNDELLIRGEINLFIQEIKQ